MNETITNETTTEIQNETARNGSSFYRVENGDGGRHGLKRILGAMLFGAKEPVTISEMRGVIQRVADGHGEKANINDSAIRAALDRLGSDLDAMESGLKLLEVAGGFKLVTHPECGEWLRELLNVGKPPRLSRPALETLAIIAFRQPVTRPEIEAVRGVNVDSIVRNLLENQLIRVLGRSDLPGRPMLYGTTQLFLEHFGLNDLKDLPCNDELRMPESAKTKKENP